MVWTVGKAKITSIVEQELDDLGNLIVAAQPEEVKKIDWLKEPYVNDHGIMKGVIQAFIVEVDGKRIVVDTCVGDDKDRALIEEWHHAQNRALDKFIAAGFPPETIDFVLCTHLHVDHVGWNTKREGDEFVPTFPNAQYLFEETEFAFWQENYAGKNEADPDDQMARMLKPFDDLQKQVYEDSVKPIVDAGLATSVSSDHQVTESVRLVPTPGHTVGHVSIEISSDGATALITGDAIHHPCQIARPEWAAIVDNCQETSTETRHRILEKAKADGRLIVGTHFCAPSAGHILDHDEGYQFKPVDE